MHVEVAQVDRPDLVAALRREWHRLRFFRRGRRPWQPVELAIQGEDPHAGARAEGDAEPLQRGVQAPFPEGGFACNSFAVAIARSVTRRGPSLRAWNFAASPATPSSTHRCKVR